MRQAVHDCELEILSVFLWETVDHRAVGKMIAWAAL